MTYPITQRFFFIPRGTNCRNYTNGLCSTGEGNRILLYADKPITQHTSTWYPSPRTGGKNPWNTEDL